MKTPLLLYSQTASSLFIPCLSAFKTTLNSSTLGAYINKCLSLNGNQLKVADRLYLLNKNVHLVAIGKAAPVMVESAEKILGQHFVDGIASVPTGSNIPNNLKTQFLFGAENNLPDEQALENTKQIENFVRFIGQPNQLILFLISGGGSALLPAPINGISLANKLEIIKLLQNYGADIKQLNVVRQALSRLKGGGLSRLACPAQQIALIVSDIIGDPIELISSGPTVILNKSSQEPMEIINKLGIKREQIGQKIIKVLEQREEKVKEKEKEVDILNVIVANNSMILKELSAHLNSAGFIPIIVTNCLEGNATKLGQSMARILVKLATQAKHLALDISNFLKEEFSVNVEEFLNIDISKNDKIVLIFGGESTVCFDSSQVLPGAKGGRNQEMVLSVLNELLLLGEEEKKKQILNGLEFVFTSLGTDGQDGPTDAAGAFICSDDLLNKSTEQLSSLSTKVKSALKEKRSYQFWSEFNEGRNIVKIGKTGMN
uniref:Glycerate kinase n=1 Tax=Meloidogyne floridensis TaxID=298350 RepID=A0A915NW28_9BILA